MTVSTSTNSVVYRGNGAATQFAVPFKVLDEDHLRVRRRVFATGTLNYTYVGTDYSYAGIGASSGTLTLTGAALSDTYELVIERIVPYTQDLDIVNAGGFYPETVEEQLDLITMGVQQIADLAGRGAVVPVGETGLELSKAADRAGKFFGFDAAGQFIALSGTGNDAALRTDLAATTGPALIGIAADFGGQYLQTLSQIRQGIPPSFLRWVLAAQHAAILDGNSTFDAGARLNVAIGDLTAETGSGATLRLPYGLINIEEQITVDENANLIGEGVGATILRSTAAAGRVLYPSPTVDNRGGICGGFTIDGDDIGEDLLKLEMGVQRMFLHIKVMQSLTNGAVLNGAQNCEFFGFYAEHNKLSNLNFDYGAGNNRFVGFELNRGGLWNLKFLQSGASTSSGAFADGPNGNRLQHGVIERLGYVNQGDLGDPDTGSGLVYNGGGQGNEISNVHMSLNNLSSTTKSMVKMVRDNASYPSTGLTLNDILWSGTAARTTALEIGANCEAILGGRHTFENHAAAFSIADTGALRGTFEASYGTVTDVFTNLGGGTSTIEALMTRAVRGRALITASAAAAFVEYTTVEGEANARFQRDGAGKQFWGPGSGVADVSFGRLGVGLVGSADKLIGTAGIGVGNSAAGSTLGTVTKKVEIFNAAGASLGFVPVYDAIT